MLELTSLEGETLLVNAAAIDAVEPQLDCTCIKLSSGHVVFVLEYVADIYLEIKSLV
jgi:uncharacterized protein YlzI (FlbEa/FlbD family)